MTTKRLNWTGEEVQVMLEVVREQNILMLTDEKKYRSIKMYEDVEKELKKRSIHWSAAQIRTKLKNLKKQFMEVKKSNTGFGTNIHECEHMDALEKIFGERPQITPLPSGIESSTSDIQKTIIASDGASYSIETISPGPPRKRNRISIHEKLLREQQEWMAKELDKQREFEKEMFSDFADKLNKNMHEFAQMITFGASHYNDLSS